MSQSITQDWGEDAEPGPEDKAKRELAVWLEDHDAAVYWEKTNQWDYPTFRVDGRRPAAEKPDMVIDFGDDIYAVEAKHGLEKSGVYDAQWQLMKYWTQYLLSQMEYVVDSAYVEIDGFLTATRWSKDGHLFSPIYESRIGAEEFGDGRNLAVQRGVLPPTEYTMTEQHIRNLWRHKKNSVNGGEEPAVGSLLSTALEGDDAEPEPAVLVSSSKPEDWEVYA